MKTGRIITIRPVIFILRLSLAVGGDTKAQHLRPHLREHQATGRHAHRNRFLRCQFDQQVARIINPCQQFAERIIKTAILT